VVDTVDHAGSYSPPAFLGWLIMLTVSAARSVPKSATAVDVPVFSDTLSDLPDDRRRAAELQGFEAKAGQSLVLTGSGGGPVEVLIGLGSSKDLSYEKLRKAAAALARAVNRHEAVATNLVTVADGLDRAEAIGAVVEGVRLASYRYTDLKSASKDKDEIRLKKVTVVAGGSGVRAEMTAANAVVDAVELSRDLVNEPGGSLTPQSFVAKAKKAAGAAGIKVTVWNEARIRKEKLGGLLAVNKGSAHPPQFLTLSYKPAKGTAKAHVALVGKGVTFDSGGLSIKTSQGMMTMKIDMAGAAAVLAAMISLPAVAAPVEVTGFIPLTDNMTGPDAQRPGDVFTARNGKTVEVLNTDAEGRLILADALSLASEAEPDAIIDIATLTGSASAALGTGYAALMATDDALAGRLEAASERTGEKLWRLPLPAEYRRQLDSPIADLRNIGTSPYGGALIAGLFLKEFVDGAPWAHIDVGLSVYSDTSKGIVVKGATGYGVRLLVDALRHWD
jgi:leucyl aminopeptidase